MGTPQMSTERTYSVDERLRALANYRRRAILRYMSENGNSASVDDLVREIITTTPSEGRQPTEDRIEAQLHHVDLPKLDETGFVEYDPQSNRVSYRPDDIAEEVLQSVDLQE